jgi:hypothetical protein
VHCTKEPAKGTSPALLRSCWRKQYHIDSLGPLDNQGRCLPHPAERLEVFTSETLTLLDKGQELVAEPPHVLLNGEPRDVFPPPCHLARNVGCPNISDSIIRAVLPTTA